MTILALDSSSKASSCALWKDNQLLASYYLDNKTTHSQTLLPMIDSMLKTLDVAIKDIDYIAVTTGPGSFTGLRIGLATVKGLAFGSDIKIVPVSTLKGMAYNLSDINGRIVVTMDARRSQVYTAVYDCCNGAITAVLPPTTLLVEQLEYYLKCGNCYFVGDGAKMCYDYYSANHSVRLASNKLLQQQAASVIELVVNEELYKTAIDQEELEVEYLRIPQAQRELEKNNKKGSNYYAGNCM